MKINGVIYKITNVKNGKVYIGKTKHDSETYFGSGVLVNRAIEKYGIELFTKEIIDYSDSEDGLNGLEKHWISHYNSTDLSIGYNIGKGGDGGDLFTNHPDKEEIRKKYSHPGEENGMWKRNHTEEAKLTISIKKKGQMKGIPTWNTGLTKEDYTPEHREHIKNMKRSPMTEENKQNQSKRMLQYWSSDKAKLRCGENHHLSKIWIFISPEGVEYTIIGPCKEFCKYHNISYNGVKYANKGIIPKPPRFYTTERENLTGWEIKCLGFKNEQK